MLILKNKANFLFIIHLLFICGIIYIYNIPIFQEEEMISWVLILYYFLLYININIHVVKNFFYKSDLIFLLFYNLFIISMQPMEHKLIKTEFILVVLYSLYLKKTNIFLNNIKNIMNNKVKNIQKTLISLIIPNVSFFIILLLLINFITSILTLYYIFLTITNTIKVQYNDVSLNYLLLSLDSRNHLC